MTRLLGSRKLRRLYKSITIQQQSLLSKLYLNASLKVNSNMNKPPNLTGILLAIGLEAMASRISLCYARDYLTPGFKHVAIENRCNFRKNTQWCYEAHLKFGALEWSSLKDKPDYFYIQLSIIALMYIFHWFTISVPWCAFVKFV